MKKIIVFSLLLIISTISFSQQTTTTAPVLTKSDYLQKSKKQKTIAWVLASGGVGMFVIAYASYNIGDVVNFIEGDNSSVNTKGFFLILGGITAVSSIPFFIASSKNKKKGNSISASFKMESRPSVVQGIVIKTPYPALSVKIGI